MFELGNANMIDVRYGILAIYGTWYKNIYAYFD